FACASFRNYETQIRSVLEQALVTTGELLVEILRFLATRRLPPQAGLSAHRTPRARNDMAFGWVLPSLQALHEALDALQRLFEERDGRGVADADVAAAAFPEGGAGDDGDF